MTSTTGQSVKEDERALAAMLGVPGQSADEPSVAQLLGGIVQDAQRLFRREFDLAKQEVTIEVNKVKQGATTLGIGIGLTAVGGIMLTLMVVYLLHEVAGLSLWLSYLIVGGVIGAVGGIMLATGMNRLKDIDPVPHETVASVKEDIAWIREQNPSDKI